MITITFVRHGQSLDNTRGIWAGWTDAVLSALGEKQARALGKAMSTTQFDAIYASPLHRAHQTAQFLHSALQSPPASIIANPDLREQHFGDAEGQPWTYERIPGKTLEEMYAMKIYPVLFGRKEKFPAGESLDDLASRAERALKDCVFPHLGQHGQVSDGDSFHIAIVSHGLCISELIAALVRLDPDAPHDRTFKGLLNTAWTRVFISLRSSSPSSNEQLPTLKVVIGDINNTDHLEHLDIRDEAKEEGSADARAFFGGGGKALSITNADVAVTADVSNI